MPRVVRIRPNRIFVVRQSKIQADRQYIHVNLSSRVARRPPIDFLLLQIDGHGIDRNHRVLQTQNGTSGGNAVKICFGRFERHWKLSSGSQVTSQYSYWYETHHAFSCKSLTKEEENPFSFTEADLIFDGNQINYCRNVGPTETD